MDPQLQTLLDERSIRTVVHRYATGIDDHDWDAVLACFVPDVDIAYENMPAFADAAGFLDVVRPVLERMGGTQHLIGNVEVALAGERAVARSYVQATHVAATGDVLVTGGRYDDELVRTPDGWRIARRRFTRQWFTGPREAVLGLSADES